MTLDNIPMQIIRNIFNEALLAVDPYKAVSRHIDYVLSRYEKEKLSKLCVVSFGKAASLMAQSLIDGIGNVLTFCIGRTALLDFKRFVFFIREGFL